MGAEKGGRKHPIAEHKMLQELRGVYVFNVARREYLESLTAGFIQEFDHVEGECGWSLTMEEETTTVIGIIAHRDSSQQLYIQEYYQTMYSEDLLIIIRKIFVYPHVLNLQYMFWIKINCVILVL